MKKTRFTEAQIISALKDYENGKSVSDISRELGINRQTFYLWHKKYAGMEKEDLIRLKDLEHKYAKLQKMYADLAMDHHVLKDVLSKKF